VTEDERIQFNETLEELKRYLWRAFVQGGWLLFLAVWLVFLTIALTYGWDALG
jgi:hypothetical protein